ncbi:MAG: tryptophan synthase subunit alpha [Microthrixaceae bacterium]
MDHHDGAIAAAGADGVEVGIPFSDPVMDGPVIQAASQEALEAGATPQSILEELTRLDLGVPTAVMTYANLVFRFGWERFAASVAEAGVAAAILPDVPWRNRGHGCDAADVAGVETVMLAAPTGDDARLAAVAERSGGSSMPWDCWGSPANASGWPTPRRSSRRAEVDDRQAGAGRCRHRLTRTGGGGSARWPTASWWVLRWFGVPSGHVPRSCG